MSTVKIRTGSLFCTGVPWNWPADGSFHRHEAAPKLADAAGFFLNPPQKLRSLHRMYTARPALGLARTNLDEAQSNQEIST
jgi:hypothetical protein